MAGISASGERPVVESEPKRQVQAKEGRRRRGRKIKICKCPCSAGKEDTSLLQVVGAEAGFRSPVQVDCEHGGRPRACTCYDKTKLSRRQLGFSRKGNNKVREVKIADVDR